MCSCELVLCSASAFSCDKALDWYTVDKATCLLRVCTFGVSLHFAKHEQIGQMTIHAFQLSCVPVIGELLRWPFHIYLFHSMRRLPPNKFQGRGDALNVDSCYSEKNVIGV